MKGQLRPILHVDDDPQITRIVAKILSRAGFSVTSIHDPLAAMDEIIRQNHRVVLLDVDMPGKSGLELLDEIKFHDGGIQVVLLTAVVSLQTTLASLRQGAEACFFKPVRDYGPLVESLEACFAKIDRWWETLDELARRKPLELKVG